MRDFDARRNQFDQEFADMKGEFDRTKRRAKRLALIAIPIYLIGVLLVFTILALIAYALARYVGLL